MCSIRNKVRRILGNPNLDRPDLFTAAGQDYLDKLTLPASERFCIDQLMNEWYGFRLQSKQTTVRLKEFAVSGSPQEQEDRELLLTIPGIGLVSTDVSLSELADWRRFSSLKKVSSYVGFVPGQRESAGKRKSLHIEKTGSPLLRWVMVQAS